MRFHILAAGVQKHINLKFDFQGSQNLHIRVSISRSDANSISLPNVKQIASLNTTFTDFMVDFGHHFRGVENHYFS